MRFISGLFVACVIFASSALAEPARVIAGIGSQTDADSGELSLRYVAPDPMFWKVRPAFGLSVAGNGSAWAGAGASLTLIGNNAGAFLRWTSMVGAYRQGSGRDLGGALQFQNALDLGYRWDNGVEAGLGANHRSNAGLNSPNPGLDTVYLFASVPLD